VDESGQDGARDLALKRLKAQRAFHSLLVTAAGILVLMIVIWLLSGRGYFWPIWVVFGLGIALITTARQAYGPRQHEITEEQIQHEMDKRG
jgi:uncharacterized membrane protein